MHYAKLISGCPSYAPRRMRVGSVIVYNPTGAQLLAEGYLPVVETPMPETDAQHYAEPHWTERGGQIVQSWVAEEIEQPPMTDEDALVRYANELTGASDPDLISAAETLITDRIKESAE